MREYTEAQLDYAKYRLERSREDLNAFLAGKTDTEEQIANAAYVHAEIRKYIDKKIL